MKADGKAINRMNEITVLREALIVIRDMPIPEQDNMLSASMRKVAAEALSPSQTA